MVGTYDPVSFGNASTLSERRPKIPDFRARFRFVFVFVDDFGISIWFCAD